MPANDCSKHSFAVASGEADARERFGHAHSDDSLRVDRSSDPSRARSTRARLLYLPSTFPAVPINKPSLRLTISRHNSFDDIRSLVAR